MSPAWERRAWDLGAALLIALALSVALATVEGLAWPYDGDHFRDIAQAQTARDGHPLADPYYAGEWVWYNPLVPWLLATLSWLTGLGPGLLHVHAGPWLNLLGPLTLWLLCVRVAGHETAFLAVALLLFVNCRTEPSLTCATYSPWLFVATFAQGLFYLGILALRRAARLGTAGAAALAGATAGLTFLAHTGPALVLGGVALLVLRPRHVAIAGSVALLVASPFAWSILVHYRLHVVNPVPLAWSWPPLTLSGFPATLLAHAPLLAAGAAGLAIVRDRVVRGWVVVASALLALALLRDAVPSMPPLVPTFHFWRYAMAAATLLAAASGGWLLVRAPQPLRLGVLAAVVGCAAWWAPRYRSRFDFVYGRSVAAARSPDLLAAGAFLHKSTPDTAVVLGSRGLSLEVIGPAGRKVVGVTANWSNPYVDATARIAARDAMLADITAGRVEPFNTLARAYGVTHAVGMGDDECGRMAAGGLQRLYRFGEVCVFARTADGVR